MILLSDIKRTLRKMRYGTWPPAFYNLTDDEQVHQAALWVNSLLEEIRADMPRETE
jgi:hypothetical protein